MPAAENKVERARDLGGTPSPMQPPPYAKEAHPVREVSARQRPSAARWAIPGIGGTAVVAAGAWLVVVPLLHISPAMHTTQVADCVPNHEFFEVRLGMTRRAVLNAFSSAGRIDQYTPGQSLGVVYRSCARTAPWTRLLWITYMWEHGEWRVAELHKGLGIVDAP